MVCFGGIGQQAYGFIVSVAPSVAPSMGLTSPYDPDPPHRHREVLRKRGCLHGPTECDLNTSSSSPVTSASGPLFFAFFKIRTRAMFLVWSTTVVTIWTSLPKRRSQVHRPLLHRCELAGRPVGEGNRHHDLDELTDTHPGAFLNQRARRWQELGVVGRAEPDVLRGDRRVADASCFLGDEKIQGRNDKTLRCVVPAWRSDRNRREIRVESLDLPDQSLDAHVPRSVCQPWNEAHFL